jgi:hypothetical protein
MSIYQCTYTYVYKCLYISWAYYAERSLGIRYMYVFIYRNIKKQLYVYIYIYMPIYQCICTYVYTCLYVSWAYYAERSLGIRYIYVFIYIYIYINRCMFIFIYMHISIYQCICTYVYTCLYISWTYYAKKSLGIRYIYMYLYIYVCI